MNKEQMLKEARTIEAMRKGYMGLEGKFAAIAKFLGYPIIRQGGLYFETSHLSDPFEDDTKEEGEIPVLDDEQESYQIGIHFDGLSRGINMTISVLSHFREITVKYEGQTVYKEVGGELEGYAPYEEWEDKIENLYNVSRKIERQRKPQEKRELAELAEKNKKEILEILRLKWGL